MSKLSYYIIDTFTAEPYSGNPAAVVLDADDLTVDQMQAIAREFNLSETAFVLNSPTPDAAISIRWFTPSTEVEMCGHATIASVHALILSGRYVTLPADKGIILPIHTAKSILTVRCEELVGNEDGAFLIWLDLPPAKLTKKQCVPNLWGLMLGVPQDAFDMDMPSAQSQDGDVLVFVKSLQPLLEAKPDFKELARFSKQQGVRGWCLATLDTLTPSIDVQSRFFAPAVGIDEDPVTGSVHGPLATYLVSNDLVQTFRQTATLTCTQSDSSARAGLIRVVVVQDESAGWRVRIAGECRVVMEGKIHT